MIYREYADIVRTGMEYGRIGARFQPCFSSDGLSVEYAYARCVRESPGGAEAGDDIGRRLSESHGICALDWYMADLSCAFLKRLKESGWEGARVITGFSIRHAYEHDTAEHLCGMADSYGISHGSDIVNITLHFLLVHPVTKLAMQPLLMNHNTFSF